jgi:hypothetical protein
MASVQKTSTVLYEVQQACILLSLQAPIGVYDVTDETALLMGAAVNLAGIMVNDAHDWQGQRGAIAFAGDGVTTEYDLPANFGRFVDGTGWSNAIKQPVIPLNAQQWAAAQAWVGSMYINPACRILGNQLVFMSPPASGDSITFEYVFATWVQDGVDPAVFKQYATLNADVPLFDWLLMVHAIRAKWLELKAMDNSGAMIDFTERFAQLTQNEILAPVLSLNGVRGGFRYLDGIYNVPITGYGA